MCSTVSAATDPEDRSWDRCLESQFEREHSCRRENGYMTLRIDSHYVGPLPRADT